MWVALGVGFAFSSISYRINLVSVTLRVCTTALLLRRDTNPNRNHFHCVSIPLRLRVGFAWGRRCCYSGDTSDPFLFCTGLTLLFDAISASLRFRVDDACACFDFIFNFNWSSARLRLRPCLHTFHIPLISSSLRVHFDLTSSSFRFLR